MSWLTTQSAGAPHGILLDVTGLLLAALAALPLPPVGPAPAWVEPIEVPTKKVAPDGATRLLLIDSQLRVEKTVEQYEHHAWKVLSQTGVAELAKQELEWDPSFEQLTLHGVWIWRGGERRVAWQPEDARVIQRERSLDEGLYDGRLTLIIELRDLREGDVVEIASTTRGENPVYQGRFATKKYQAWGQHIERSHFRLSWERPRLLHLQTHGGAQAPALTTEDGHPVYRWELAGLEAQHFEAGLPADVEPAPWVEFSDWQDWAEVALWAQSLFAITPDGKRFEAEAARFQALPEPERARAIVRFVQDDVRYVGVEIGENSHRPHTPAWVLDRGFGDCKDKSLLLVSLLRAAGLEAWPSLVHASAGQRLPKSTPSPDVFNHAIVQVALKSGPRFIDPTVTLQRGSLEERTQPRYHHALVVKPGVTALLPIPLEEPKLATWEVEQHWQRPSPTGIATLTVTTTARGWEAASLRRKIKSSTQDELARTQRSAREDVLNRQLKPLELTWTDDEAAELFVLKESYEAADFFEAGSHRFTTLTVGEDLKRLDVQERRWPFALWYPLRVREVIRYDAPERLRGAEFELTNRSVTHDTFRLDISQHLSGNTLELDWELRMLKDRVLPAQVKSYRTAIAEAWEHLGYTVRSSTVLSPDAISEEDSELPGVAMEQTGAGALLATGGGFAFAVFLVAFFLVSRSDKARAAPPFRDRLAGAPGEVAGDPVSVASMEAAVALFTSARCPQGHGWQDVGAPENVRLGEERITVLSRRCHGCDAREARYVKLSG